MHPTHLVQADLRYLQTYDAAVMLQAFNSLVHDTEIAFDFPQGGCQQRAEIMSMYLHKKLKIDHCKVWLFAPAALYSGDSRTLFIDDKNGLTAHSKIEWNYHVAPVVRVIENDKVQTMVLDPSIHKNEHILLEQWFNAIGKSNISQYSFVLPDRYFFYCSYDYNGFLTTLFDGSFYNYEGLIKNDLILEKGLAINDMAIHIYHHFIAPLMASATETDKVKLEDLKAVFGNTTALDLLFSQNISGYTPNTTHRYVISFYNDVMTEARRLFNERLGYWTAITNQLFAL